jgi:hypothetical protein
MDAYRSATPFEQGGWTLAFVAAAITIPAVLRWILGGIATEGTAQTGYPGAAAWMAVHATSQLIQWIGAGILAGLAGMCVWLMIGHARGSRGRGAGIPAWTVAGAYAVGAVAALAGALWFIG